VRLVIEKIFRHHSLLSRPPILVDIGASGRIHEKWKNIAKYSICIAFDADKRDFNVSDTDDDIWQRKYTFNRLVAKKSVDEIDFFLTHSPHCSSSLPPNQESLKFWAFKPLFDVEKILKIPAIDLNSAMKEVGVDYIDWYKTDSQGTDLRIFDSLPKNTIKNILVAEFEPGIIDAYHDEDKLHQLMSYMENEPFWISNMIVKGSQRINQKDFRSLNFLQRNGIGSFLKTAPGWCEITYLNKMEMNQMTLREYLLAWIFASINAEHGFALSIVEKASEEYSDSLLASMKKESQRKLSYGYYKLVLKILKRITRLK